MRSLRGTAIIAFAAAVSLSGCGGGAAPAPSHPKSLRSQDSAPNILSFDGPSEISCARNGEVKTVSFAYEVANATTVTPAIDGAVQMAFASLPAGTGTVEFEYLCPGPHTLEIMAIGEGNGEASSSVTFDQANRAVSSTSSGSVEAQAAN